jgi:hypothetical protein
MATPKQPKTKDTKIKDDVNKNKGFVIIPYVKGISERISRTMKGYNIATAMKPHCTIRNQLVYPKDKRDKLDITNAIYDIPCMNCKLSYVGETGRKFSMRLEEHKTEAEKVINTVVTRAGRLASLSTTNKSAITDHVVDSNHVIGWTEARVLGTEQDKYKRWIKEAIEIRKKRGTIMNRDEGQYFLTHIFYDLLSEKTTSTSGKKSGNTTTVLSNNKLPATVQ